MSSEPKKLGLDTVKPKVNVDTFIYSSKSAKACKGSVDALVKKTLMPYFKLEHKNDVCWYYARTAPVCYNTNMVRCDHKAFYTSFGIKNETDVCRPLCLNVSVTNRKEPLSMSKVLIVVDGQKFDITSSVLNQGSNLFLYYINYVVYLDTEEYGPLAWALYNAKSAKILSINNGEPDEMIVTKEELEYIRHGINMYIACGQRYDSKL